MVRRSRGRRRRGGVGATAPHHRPASGKAPAAPAQRRCIVTGESGERAALLRLVVGPDGTIVPDVAARLPGRGLWLTPRRDIVDRAVAKRVFTRVARRPVAAAPELADRIESLLAQRCCDALGLARRAGHAVAGFDRVEDALRRSRAGLLLVALDGAEGGPHRLAAPARAVPTARVLTAAELGGAFGRARIVYVAVASGSLCRRLAVDLARLAGLRHAAAIDGEVDFAPVEPVSRDGGTESA